ncbi:hypothetical protein SAMN05421682_110113 [Chryseobacterium indoltheticum]|uniref:Uncharacterized protein n=1 Tax=Chryseobacterium indoltheticum TaxID=254 RepID=A0A381FBK2_9FLAO|nr:hypothetical protein SAMN05421682_110113 [Chryseobacterium indoltheticum]SUX43961.1 Uncharacterised protein [Chryseobacterium indoltheticum]
MYKILIFTTHFNENYSKRYHDGVQGGYLNTPSNLKTDISFFK